MTRTVDNGFERVATVTIVRCERDGLYAVHVDFLQHAEARRDIVGLDAAMAVATDARRAGDAYGPASVRDVRWWAVAIALAGSVRLAVVLWIALEGL